MGPIQKIILGSVSLMLLEMACQPSQIPDCFQAGGNHGTLEMVIPAFEEIVLQDHLHYILHQDSVFHCTIEGPENLLNEIDFHLEDQTLTVSNQNTCNIVRSYNRNISVHIYAPYFSKISNESTLQIDCADTLKQPYLYFHQSQASSNTTLLLHCDSVWVEIPTGHGDVCLKGQSSVTKLYSGSVGILDARNLFTRQLFCNQSAIQDMFVRSTEYAYIEITNLGNVFFATPTNQVDLNLSGEGQYLALP